MAVACTHDPIVVSVSPLPLRLLAATVKLMTPKTWRHKWRIMENGIYGPQYNDGLLRTVLFNILKCFKIKMRCKVS